MSGYKSTLKNTVAFGGLQIVTIFLNLIKGKFVAMYLGPAGIGLNNLLLNTMNVITTFNDLGLDLSAVRNLSEAHESEDEVKVNRTISIVQRLFFYTAVLGALVCAVLSPMLSQWTFGSSKHTVSYLLLSLFVFFTTLSKGQQTVLRGLRRVNFILKAGFFGTLAGVVVSVPLYFFYGEKGIVPTLLFTSFFTFFLSWFYYRKIPKTKVSVTNQELWSEGKQMMKLGIMLVFSILMGMLVKYLISVGIGRMGNIKDVGLYAAAMSISGQYVGFIMASLGADYFPRLSAVSHDTEKVNTVVNDQAEIVLLLATPLLILMIITSPLLIRVLLTKEFLGIIDFIRFIALGSFFQLASYCMGYISFAKNDRKTYVLMEGIMANATNLILSLVLYYFFGIFGLSIAFLGINVVYLGVILTVTGRLYGFKTYPESRKFFFISLAFILAVFFCFYIPNLYIAYGIATVLFILNALYTYKHLNTRMDIVGIIKSKLNRKKP